MGKDPQRQGGHAGGSRLLSATKGTISGSGSLGGSSGPIYGTKKTSSARQLLDKLSGEPLTFGSLLKNIRDCDELSLSNLAAKLKVSRQHLHAIETDRKFVSTARAARWVRLLGYSEAQFVRLALQGEVDAAGLKYRVQLDAA